MENDYVEKQEAGYRVKGTRVSLDSVVIAFLQGLSPETIVAECFPMLNLEQVYGAIAYYLAHRVEIDTYLRRGADEFELFHTTTHSIDPAFAEKLASARRQQMIIHS